MMFINSLGAYKFSLFLAGCAACFAVPAVAQVEWRPERNIEVIVGTSPGGAADNSARLLQKLLQQMKMGSSTVVNKPGGSYSASFAYLNTHAADGHYIAISPINLVTNRIVGAGTPESSRHHAVGAVDQRLPRLFGAFRFGH